MMSFGPHMNLLIMQLIFFCVQTTCNRQLNKVMKYNEINSEKVPNLEKFYYTTGWT